jgi:hypothetical protein
MKSKLLPVLLTVVCCTLLFSFGMRTHAAKDPAAILIQGASDNLATDSGYPVKIGGVYNTSAPAPANGQRVDAQMDSSGNLKITGAVWAIPPPAAISALSTYRNISLVATGVNIKGSQGAVVGWYIANNATSARFVKLYNKAMAPTVGTDTPLCTIQVPASSATNISFTGGGINFAAGIGIAATNLVADADTTAPSANDVVCNVFYQ